MTLQAPILTSPSAQRARGLVSVSAEYDPARGSFLRTLRQEGSYRTVFPRPASFNTKTAPIETVMINTAGGVTGGDQFSAHVTAHEGARMCVTTQAAERIYRSSGSDSGQITSELRVSKGAGLYWLPQETILFDGSRLERRLSVDVDPEATFLMVEPLIFGRTASGEEVRSGALDDSVSITSGGQPIYLDRVHMTGDIAATLGRKAIADQARAMASVVLVHRDARDRLSACRDLIPPTAGVSMLSDTVLVARFLAPDSFALRGALFPILTLLTDNAVPKNWRL